MNRKSSGSSNSDGDEHFKEIVYNSPTSIDRLLSKELHQLSLRDRNAIEEEIHGVSTLAPTRTESPEFLDTSLRELSKELREIPGDCKTAYNESQILADTYVNTQDFRLRFLRCEFFDAKKAATRMVRFLDLASSLFGPMVLQRPMRMDDFTKEEKKWMQNIQILPYRDQSGRPLWAWVGDHGLERGTPESVWKVVLYYRYCLSDDIETQQKGFVSVIWIGSNQMTMPVGWEHFEYSKKVKEAAPVRNCSMHWCMPELPLFHPIHIARCSMALSVGKGKSRMKYHIGNKIELFYKLRSYGIPVEWIPVRESGSIKTIFLRQWIKGRKQLEEQREKGSSKAPSTILLPRSKDVLFRSGTSLKCHPGNAVFESIIEAKLEKHWSAPKQNEKVAIIKAIIGTIQQNEGRFLVWSKQDGCWNVMDDASQIHTKVAEKMRKRTLKSMAQQQTSKSSTAVFRNQDNRKRRKLSSPRVDSDGTASNSQGCHDCFGIQFHSVD